MRVRLIPGSIFRPRIIESLGTMLWNTIGDKITARKFDCSVRVLWWWSSSIRQLGFLVRELGFSVRELSFSVRELGFSVRELSISVRKLSSSA